MEDISRRSVLKKIEASGAAGALATSPVALAGSRDKELNILCREGYNSARVPDPFRKKYGATVKAESATSDPTMVNKIRAGENKIWDLVNNNNPRARRMLHPGGFIKPLDEKVFAPYFEKKFPTFKYHYEWSMSLDGKQPIGMSQRFGPYNFVVVTDKSSKKTAGEQGWHLWDDGSLNGKFGIQENDDRNVFDIFLIAGIDPFKEHTEQELEAFSKTAVRIFKNIRLIGDIAALNQAIVNGDIVAYLSGRTYTASPARLDGYSNIRAIFPLQNSTMRVEITEMAGNPNPTSLAAEFLKYVQDPEVAHQVAFAEGTYNQVTRMGAPTVSGSLPKRSLTPSSTTRFKRKWRARSPTTSCLITTRHTI